MPPRSPALRLLGLVTAGAAAISLLFAAPARAQAAPPEHAEENPAEVGEVADTPAPADIRAVALAFEATNDVERWLGGPVDGVLTLTITNRGATAATDVVASAQVGDRVTLFPAVDLAPGATARIQTDLSLGGMSFLERDVVATVDDSRLAVAHRSVPWILIALIGFGVNVALIAGRDHLRAAVRRRVEAAGPATA